jgi:hypothetical protein
MLKAHVETETIEFAFNDFAAAWITASPLEPEQTERPISTQGNVADGDDSRSFRNDIHLFGTSNN